MYLFKLVAVFYFNFKNYTEKVYTILLSKVFFIDIKCIALRSHLNGMLNYYAYKFCLKTTILYKICVFEQIIHSKVSIFLKSL